MSSDPPWRDELFLILEPDINFEFKAAHSRGVLLSIITRLAKRRQVLSSKQKAKKLRHAKIVVSVPDPQPPTKRRALLLADNELPSYRRSASSLLFGPSLGRITRDPTVDLLSHMLDGLYLKESNPTQTMHKNGTLAVGQAGSLVRSSEVKFHLFDQLPLELRRMIWKFALPRTPRLLTVKEKIFPVLSNAGIGEKWLSDILDNDAATLEADMSREQARDHVHESRRTLQEDEMAVKARSRVPVHADERRQLNARREMVEAITSWSADVSAPIILQVSYESRQEALRYYKGSFGVADTSAVYIDPGIDTLLICEWNFYGEHSGSFTQDVLRMLSSITFPKGITSIIFDNSLIKRLHNLLLHDDSQLENTISAARTNLRSLKYVVSMVDLETYFLCYLGTEIEEILRNTKSIRRPT